MQDMKDSLMEIEIQQSGDVIHVTLYGNLDTNGDKKLAETLNKIRKIKKYNKVIFHMTEVTISISSSIGRLLNFYKFLESTERIMEINGISDSLYNQFKEIHLEKIFVIKQ
jgi:anti-anti-sigma factor